MKRAAMMFLIGFLIALSTQTVRAENGGVDFFVTSFTDGADTNPGDGFCDDGNGDCGLRTAVTESNALAGTNEILIVLPGIATINLSQQIPVTDNITIRGASPATTRIDGGGQVRLFDVTSARLTLENMTLREANGGISNGGAIRTNNNSSNFVGLINVVVKNNEAHNGGALYVLGNLTIQNSIIENNRATFAYGGVAANLSQRVTIIGNSIIRNNTAGTNVGGLAASNLNMTNSAVYGNSAENDAGGLQLGSGTHNLTQVTVSGNSADSAGGIKLGTGTLNLSNVTVTNNEARAAAAGGIESNGTITVRNSILAGNFGSHPDCAGGTWISEGYNLVGLVTSGCNWAGDTDNDLFATTAPAIDPDLGVLQFSDHDGDGTDDLTPTHEPNDTSRAVNGGHPDGCRQIGSALPFPMTNDQRGADRHQQGRCDMGSAESPHEPAELPTAIQLNNLAAQNTASTIVSAGLITMLLLTVAALSRKTRL